MINYTNPDKERFVNIAAMALFNVPAIVLGKTEENCQKAATRYFVNNHIKGAAVPIDLVKSTYSVEEESTIISFDVRKV